MNKVFLRIAAEIILSALMLFVLTFVSELDYVTQIFGDKICEHNEPDKKHIIVTGVDWGIRHYVYFLLSIALFIVNIFRVVHSVKELIRKTKHL